MRLHCDRGVLQIPFQWRKLVDLWAFSHFLATIVPDNRTLFHKQVIHRDLTLDISGVHILVNTIGCNHRNLKCLFGLCLDLKCILLPAEFGIIVLCNHIFICTILHFTDIDDIILSVKEKIYLGAIYAQFFIGLCSPRTVIGQNSRYAELGLNLRDMA